MNRPELEALKQQLAKYLDLGYIKSSSSPAASPVLFVKKPDGGLRFCVDYRGLNDVTVKNSYPLPLVKETLGRTSQARVFTKLDLTAAFHQIRMARGHEWKTAFRTRFGLFEFNVMPFGLTNAPATFQNFINEVLGLDILDVFCNVYVDDILIFSEDPAQHVEHVREVLRRLHAAGLRADINKCEFNVSQVRFLGLILHAATADTPGTVSIDPRKVEAITNWKRPTTVRGLREFLGLGNFLRPFIRGYARIAAPLFALTGKGANVTLPWAADSAEERAFQRVKRRVARGPVLQQFNPEQPITVVTDASDTAVGAVMLQPDQAGRMHPTAYFSKKHDPAERNYDIHDKELLGVYRAAREWSSELRGSPHPVNFLSDHKNLLFFARKQALTSRQIRWEIELSQINYRIAYIPGKTCCADPLSRRDQDDCQKERDADRVRTLLPPDQWVAMDQDNLPIRLRPIRVSQMVMPTERAEKLLRDAYAHLEEGDPLLQARQALETGVRRAGNLPLSDLCIDDGLVWVMDADGRRVWIPENEELRGEILRLFHSTGPAAHPGSKRTYWAMRRSVFWPRMYGDAKRYARNCAACVAAKPSRETQGYLRPLPTAETRWRDISMDFMTDLPVSQFGNSSVWVVVDRLTKQCHLIPLKSMATENLVFPFLREIVRLHGLPSTMVSDRGPQFTSELWRGLTDALGIQLLLSTAYHPQTDGQSERMIQSVEHHLRTLVAHDQADWETHLPLVEFAINNSVSESTGMTPFFANLGQHPRMISPPAGGTATPPKPIDAHLGAILENLRASLAVARDAQTEMANAHRTPSPRYKVGDQVMLSTRNLRTARPCRKFDDRWIGPFPVTRVVNPRAVRLALPSNMRVFPTFSVNSVRPVAGDPFPGQPAPTPRPGPISDSDEEIFEAHEILNARKAAGRRPFQYHVRWRGWGPEGDTWEPRANLENVVDMVDDFHRRHPSKPRPQGYRPALMSSSEPRPLAGG
jgi:transposase InsO family protein